MLEKMNSAKNAFKNELNQDWRRRVIKIKYMEKLGKCKLKCNKSY